MSSVVQENRVIVVLGMHRSGTSAITRALALLGVGLGDDLHPAGEDNPKGFWEDRSILQINEQLLGHLGSAYDRLGLDWKKLEHLPDIEALRHRAIEHVTQKLRESNGLWGFKDPRTCRLLSFWLEIFRSVGCKASFVITLRNPASVVSSLAKRNGMPAEKAYLLWLQHMLLAAVQVNEGHQVFVDYDKLMDAPYEQLARIARALDLDLPPEDDAAVQKFKNEFLDPELRHTRYSLDELALDNRAPPGVIELYRLLSVIAQGAGEARSDSVRNSLNELCAHLSSFSPLFRYVNGLEDETHVLAAAVAARDDDIASLTRAINERDAEIKSLALALAERDAKIVDVSQAVTDRDREIASLSKTVAETNARIAEMSQAVAKRDRNIAYLSETLAVRAATNGERYKSEFSALSQAVGQRDERISHLERSLSDARGELDQMLLSKSWRITAPLRSLRRVSVELLYARMRRELSARSRDLWRALPLSSSAKHDLKGLAFRNLPWLFRWSKAYEAWKQFERTGDSLTASAASLLNKEVYVPLLDSGLPGKKRAKVICFYLPQFHAIPENDEWWGKGFTEWTNVRSAKPQFAGHYQPRVPGELGYYNLLERDVQYRQVELAKLYGISGFCFYFYWFGGKRLLEAPIENYLNNSSLDLPFCLCWANENWTRRWDGMEAEVLIGQRHSPDDDLAFISHVSRYLTDPRYIRVAGKPLLTVYRPSLFPSARDTAGRWRQWCRTNGVGEIYLAYTQSFETVDPSEYGFDAAIEFPPNNSAPPDITRTVTPLDGELDGRVYDWRVFVERSEKYTSPPYTLFRAVCPSWDNTPRRKKSGTVFLNSTPVLYQRWLENAIRDAEQRHGSDNRLIFANAWNEWGEGAYLEPDLRYGYAYLQATRNALSGEAFIPDNHRKIVLVAHDAYPHGAQLLILNLARTLHEAFRFHVDIVCLGDGPLKSEYAKWGDFYDLAGLDPEGSEADNLVRKLYDSGQRSALVNTTVCGYFLKTLSAHGFRCVAMIHELRGVLDAMNLGEQASCIARFARKVVFPAKEVARAFTDVTQLAADKTVIRPQGLYKRTTTRTGDRAVERSLLRQKLGLRQDAQVVLGVGYADHRKGIDLFVDAAMRLAKQAPTARWVWVGHWEQAMRDEVEKRLALQPSYRDLFVFPEFQADTDLFYKGADLFALTSREDPFPSVVLEALDSGLPVVAFERAGGFAGLIEEGCGRLVAPDDTAAFAAAVGELLQNPAEREALGQRGAELVKSRFSFRHYVFDLLALAGIGMERVSAIVPNYNYAQYLPERLSSIINQDYPVYEIIFLDDASTDESVSIANACLDSSGIDYSIVVNDRNSGSVFSQWKKGVGLASGTHVWIAEADDQCSTSFITEVISGFRTPGVVLSYCESRQIDETGATISTDYLEYVSDIDGRRWRGGFVNDGRVQIEECLSIKNTIPNVSAILFERPNIHSVLTQYSEMISSYRIAGDWLLYTLILENGKIAFSPAPLNFHRRHKRSVTLGNLNQCLVEEIRRMQLFVADRYKISAERRHAAKKYVESLGNQLGLSVSEWA